MRIITRTCLLLWAIAVFCCKENRKEGLSPIPGDSTTAIKYAEGFRISLYGKHKLVEVTYPYQGATSGYKYLLIPKGEEIPAHDPSVKVIRIPVERIVCTSTTHVPLLDYLGETNSLVGFPTTDYISSEKMRANIDDGKVAELGIDKGMNIEKLAVLKPDLVMGYTMTGDYGQYKKIEELNIPVVMNGEYLEKHPLGRAEWIKFMALFFGEEDVADSVFSAIERNYLETMRIVSNVEHKPTVMSGIVYGDAWFLPGGQNYAARILKDAGCDYLWADDSSHGFLQMSFEKIYEKAHKAELWIGTGQLNSLKALEAADHRYAKFEAFKNRKVYSSDARRGARGGSEILELGYLRPDIILKDLVKISHPELLPQYQLYFHQKLE